MYFFCNNQGYELYYSFCCFLSFQSIRFFKFCFFAIRKFTKNGISFYKFKLKSNISCIIWTLSLQADTTLVKHIFQVPKWTEINGKIVTVEIELLSTLTRHENIISMREWFEDDDHFIIIFDRPKNHKDLFGKSKNI